MTAPTLKEALRLVETLGIAPMARIWAARPKSYVGSAYTNWNRRRAEVELEVAANLGKHGAAVSLQWDGARVRFAGFAASSTMGLQGALRNWKAGAEKRLSGGVE